MNDKQLKGDLSLIENTVERADVPQAMKRVIKEVLEWNRGLVDQTAELGLRIEGLEGAVDELLEGVEEGISTETAKVILTALEQSRLLCAAVQAMLTSEENPLDDLTTKRFAELVRTNARSIATAMQAVQEIVIADDDGDDDAGDEDGDDDDAGEDADADTAGEEADVIDDDDTEAGAEEEG